MHRSNRIRILIFLLITLAMALQADTVLNAKALRENANRDYRAVSRKVLAFYYPWYGTREGPGGAGR